VAVFYPKLAVFSIVIIALVTFLTPKSSKPFDSPILLPPKYSLKDLTKHPAQTTFVSVGDIMLGRYCNVQMIKNNSWRYPFLKTADFLSSAEITFGNLEAPFFNNCPTTEKGMIFCARPESIEGLKFAGINLVSLANNHILNYGQEGFAQTKELLNQNRISYTDSQDQAVKKINEVVFGFLAFDLVTYPQTDTLLKVREKKDLVDILIVSLHWGAEYQKEPSVLQKKLARQIIDAGAKVIIGHHPHVTQPVEQYNNGLIFYSLGNFIFDQAWSQETKKGEIAKIIFEEKKIKSYELFPIYSNSFCQPELLK